MLSLPWFNMDRNKKKSVRVVLKRGRTTFLCKMEKLTERGESGRKKGVTCTIRRGFYCI